MSLDTEEQLKRFWASSPQTDYEIEVLEVAHSAMTKTYYLWKQPYPGQVTLETGAVVAVEPVNLEIKPAGSEGHLDQQFDIAIDTTDIEDEFRSQLDRVPLDTIEKIRAVYRSYLASDLASPQSVARLQVETATYAKGAARLSAVSPRLNMTRTGVLYSYRDIPMLRGFL